MATNIIVNPSELESAAGVIEGWNNELFSKLGEFKNIVTGLQETWQSRASERTMDAINALSNHFEEYKQTIAEYVTSMKVIAEEYSNKEGDNATRADSTAEFI